MRVLVVDDDEHLRYVIAELLRDDGHEVLLASDGREALALAARRPGVDVVVTDVWMPGIDGIELVRRLRAARSDLPVLLISGSADRDTIELDLDDPRTRFLAKPFDIDALRDQVVELSGCV